MEEKYIKRAEELITFLNECPTHFHFVEKARKMLSDNGFVELDERSRFSLERGKSYFVTRNSSAMIAFRIPENFDRLHIISAHTDSPCFRIKGRPESKNGDMPNRLNVETYGGLLLSPWLDRPLSIAGRVFVKGVNGLEERLVKLDTTVLIPNLAIHQNREANTGWKISVQKEMLPIYSDESLSIIDEVAEKLSVDKSDILDMDLYLANSVDGMIWGRDKAYFSAARIDDLECAYASLVAITENPLSNNHISMIALFDNEETGSGTKQGALSDFLSNTIARITSSLGLDEEERLMLISSSRMVSADNAHAVHPAWPEKADITNKVHMNKGVVIKYAANQKYTTDGESGSFIKDLMDRNGIPHQDFYNNSDVSGGSTLGNLSSQKVSIRTCDIGMAQLAMHSPYETGGVKDVSIAIDFFKAFL